MISIFPIVIGIVGISIWLVGVGLIIYYLLDHSEPDISERIGNAFAVLLVFGATGIILNISGIISPVKDIVITYENPSSILKTNNVTVISHVINGSCVIRGQVSTSAEYWNATNIMIEVKSGKNFWGYDIDPDCEVVLH